MVGEAKFQGPSRDRERIPDQVLESIADQIREFFKQLGVKSNNVRKIKFGKNYFELSSDEFRNAYSYHYNGKAIATREGKPKPPPLEEKLSDDVPLPLGFTGKVRAENDDKPQPAVVLDRSLTYRDRYLTTIHEMIHMYSHNARGFRSWADREDKPEELNENGLIVLDEGATELFARVVSYELDRYRYILITNGLPAYAYSLAVVCDIAEKVSLSALGKAYFDGDWTGFKKEIEKVKDWQDYFKKISGMQIAESMQHAFSDLKKKFGVHIPTRRELQAAMLDDAYLDPGLKLWRQSSRSSTTTSKSSTTTWALGVLLVVAAVGGSSYLLSKTR